MRLGGPGSASVSVGGLAGPRVRRSPGPRAAGGGFDRVDQPAGAGAAGGSAVTPLTLTCAAVLIVVGSEVIPSLEPLSWRACEPPRPGTVGAPAGQPNWE